MKAQLKDIAGSLNSTVFIIIKIRRVDYSVSLGEITKSLSTDSGQGAYQRQKPNGMNGSGKYHQVTIS